MTHSVSHHVRTLTKALQSLPRLQSIAIIDGYTQAPGMSAVSDLTLMPPTAAKETRARDVFPTVIRALARLSSPMREFAIMGSEVTDMLPPRTFLIPQREKPLIAKAFRGLRRLRLNSVGLDLGFDNILRSGGLATLYNSAPNIEDLALDFRDGRFAIFASIALLFGTKNFPRLRRVGLREIEFELRDLMAFLLRHAATLRVLHLNSIYLCGKTSEDDGRKPGLWVNAFEHMRTKLQLEQASFDGVLVDRHFTLNLSANLFPYAVNSGDCIEFEEEKVLAEDYVMGKCDVNPLAEMEEERRSANHRIKNLGMLSFDPTASEDEDQRWCG